MPISINPNLISGAVPYPSGVTSFGTVSNVLPKEGEYCVPMQFDFKTVKVWKVDLSFSLGQKLSQLRALYLDATNSAIDAIVYFPDSGFEASVRSGYSNLISLPNRRYNYVFYVLLIGAVNDPTSVINIIATNVMLPPFNTYNLFVSPPQQFMGQVNNSLLSPTFIQGLELGGFQAVESNLGVMLIGAKSGARYSVDLSIFTAKYPSQTVIDQILVTHNVKNTGLFESVDLNGVHCYMDYFFFRDVFNFPVPSNPFFFPLNIHVTVKSGIDGGLYQGVGFIYSSINWIFSGIA